MKYKSLEFLIHILDCIFINFNRYNYRKFRETIKSINSFTKLRK